MALILILLTIAILITAGSYNSLISKRNKVYNVFSTVDVLLQKRYDLIPNLVAIVKAYTDHEHEVFEEIASLREMTLNNQLSYNEKVDLDNRISSCFGQILALTEGYPELKSSESYLHLQMTLVEIEEQISASRRAYNAMVTDYNNAIETFPTNIFANAMNFKKMELFQATFNKTEFTL